MPLNLIRRLTSRTEDGESSEKVPKPPKTPKESKSKAPVEKEMLGRVARVQQPGAAPIAEDVTIAVRMPQEMVERSAGFEILGDRSTGPIMFKNVKYDEWRKHYAKDKAGNYRGTEEPAVDCLLRPEEMAYWRQQRERAARANVPVTEEYDDGDDDAETLHGGDR